LLEVTIYLGKEIIKQYLLDSFYNDYLKYNYVTVPVQSDSLQIPKNTNTKTSLLMGKNNNKSLVKSTE
jgi:hypothetical protein